MPDVPKKPEWRLQHGAKLIWKDPKGAGVMGKELEGWPESARWITFDNEAHRDRFLDHYHHDYGNGRELQRDIEKFVLGVRLVAETEWEVERG